MSKNAPSTTRGRAPLLATCHVVADIGIPDPSVFLHVELTGADGTAVVTIRKRYGLDRTELTALERALGGGRAGGWLRGALEPALAAPAGDQHHDASTGTSGTAMRRRARTR